MKKRWFALGALALLLGLSFLPLFPDPYHEKTEQVCFWEWLYKEIRS